MDCILVLSLATEPHPIKHLLHAPAQPCTLACVNTHAHVHAQNSLALGNKESSDLLSFPGINEDREEDALILFSARLCLLGGKKGTMTTIHSLCGIWGKSHLFPWY